MVVEEESYEKSPLQARCRSSTEDPFCDPTPTFDQRPHSELRRQVRRTYGPPWLALALPFCWNTENQMSVLPEQAEYGAKADRKIRMGEMRAYLESHHRTTRPSLASSQTSPQRARLLQQIGSAIHPPCLQVTYTGVHRKWCSSSK